ncbi:MAG: hypothetical protein KJO35_01515 [Gammaproteobacteria bacterium]|nr:hypothetical protein [Gammaproteobacteria bacterium]
MRLRRYLGKLDPRNILLDIQARAMTQDICATIDPEGLFELRKEYKGKQALMDFKYFNMEPYVRMSVLRALKLGIVGRRKVSILDMGTGFGYFPYVCMCLHGHTIKAFDIPGQALYDAVTEFLEIEKQHYAIEKFVPLKSFGMKFDYITGFLIAFDRPNPPEVWGPEEWDFFISDIRENHLTDTGVLFLELNFITKVQDWYMPGVRDVFKKHGAELKANEARIPR